MKKARPVGLILSFVVLCAAPVAAMERFPARGLGHLRAAENSLDAAIDRARSDAAPGFRRSAMLRAAAEGGLGPLLAMVAGTSAPETTPGGSLAELVRTVKAARLGVAAASADARVARVPDQVVSDGDVQSVGMLARAGVDTEALRELATSLAVELDGALPFLHAWAERAPRGDGGPCDLIEQLPWLCVGGPGENTYGSDAALTIDLGGNDVYTNASGGANGNLCGLGTPDPARPYCQVAIVIDLAGDDTYRPSAGRADSLGQVAVLGSAISAIGFLIDEGGDDTYSPSVDEDDRAIAAHGFATVGVGVLRDLEGNDTYTSKSIAPSRAALLGQGYGALGSVGILHDAVGNDTYSMVAGPSTDVSSVHGQGSGEFQGLGLLLDGGGTDSLAIEAIAHGAPSEAPRVDLAVAWGQGNGTAGEGFLLMGEGDTRYSVVARSSSSILSDVPAANVKAHGVTTSSGVGMLDDAGGNDSYEALAEADERFDLEVLDGCGCSGANLVISQFTSPSASVRAQAYASPILGSLTPETALGLFSDRSGNDRYDAGATVSVDAEARDGRPDGAARVEFAFPFPASASFEGRGLGANAPAIFVDAGGDDAHNVNVGGTAGARAISRQGGPSSAVSFSPRANATAYGAGAHGTFVDLGGLDDYVAVARSRADASPSPLGAVDLMSTGLFFGEFGGVFLDSDAGQLDDYLVDPQREIVIGQRGQGLWGNAGLGAATSSASKAPATLEILAMGARTAEGFIPVEIRLTSSGTPLPGREVWVEVSERSEVGTWYPLEGSSHAPTDQGGRAALMLNLDFAMRHAAAGRSRRLEVRFSGDRSLAATTARQDLTS